MPLNAMFSCKETTGAEGYFYVINWCQWDIHNGMVVVQARQHLLKIAPMLYLYGDAYAFPYKHNTFWDKGQLSSIQAAACSLPLPVPSIDG